MGGRTSKGEDRPGPPPKPEIGFDDFELLRAIGRGSFGKVRRDVSRNSSGKKGAKFKFGNLFLQVMARKSLAGSCLFLSSMSILIRPKQVETEVWARFIKKLLQNEDL